ncbi:MAG: hypothetical protein WCO63_07510 [Bacteroidota bacterium]
MSKYLKLSVILLIYVLCSAKSCNNRNDMLTETQLLVTRDSLTRQFQQASLTCETSLTFGATAKQKLSDICDYLNITMDPTLDKPFRLKAASLLGESFHSNTDSLEILPDMQISIKDFCNEAFISKNFTQKGSITFDSIRVLKSLQRESDSLYIGKMCFIQRANSNKQKNFVIDFYAIKRNKSFGAAQIRVWEIKLGSIFQFHADYAEIRKHAAYAK